MKFAQPIEEKLSDEISLFVPSAWLNPKGLPIIEAQFWNGTMFYSNILNVANHSARVGCIKSVLQRVDLPADKIEDALLLIAGNLTTTLADSLTEDATADARPSQATQLIELASDAEFFHSKEGDAYVTVKVGNHKETFPVKVKAFRRYLMRRFYEQTKLSASAQAVQDAIGVLEGRALFDGPELPVYIRVAGHDGKIYVDLCNENWEAVEITSTGYRVVAEPPVKFRRARGMLALPHPVADGSVSELLPFLNIGADTADGRDAKIQDYSKSNTFVLLCALLAQALRPQGPYPLLVLHGEQGSAKSTTQLVLRSLIDPNVSPLRTAPRNEHDLMIAANNGWCVAFDNLSDIPVWLSDSLCRVATGGGFATRELYSDSDEVILDAQRPVFLNGIEELATRGDLLDRAIVAYLPAIPDGKRKTQAEFWAEFEQARPRLLGALYNALSAAMANLPNTKLSRLPRMADFALWATAAERGFGFAEGTFMAAYADNRGSANDLVLESSPVASVLIAFIQQQHVWLNTAGELLKALNGQTDEATQRQHGWPKNPRSLSNKLRRLAPNLRAAGVSIEFDILEGHKKTRKIHIEWKGDFASAAPANQESQQNEDLGADASAGANSTADTNPADCGRNTEHPADDSNPNDSNRLDATADAADAADAKKQTYSNDAFGVCQDCDAPGIRLTPCDQCGGSVL